jgi:hypothetical protein
MVSLSVVDHSHFGVGLCRWLLSGLFARHAEFAWQDKYGQRPSVGVEQVGKTAAG